MTTFIYLTFKMIGTHYRQGIVCIISLQISRRSSSALYIFTFVPQLGGW